MKICIITPGVGGLPLPPVRGGAVENLIDIYLKYNDEYFQDDITVYSCELSDAEVHSKDYKYTKFNYIDCHTNRYKFSRFLRYMINRLPGMRIGNAYISQISFVDNDYDVVLIENRPDYGMSIRKFFKKAIMLHLHNDVVDASNKRYLINSCTYNKILTVSNYIKTCVCEKLPQADVQTVYNGVDIERFSPVNFTSEMILKERERWGLSASEYVIVFSGRINKDKGIKELIEAFLMLPENQEYKLLVVGSSVYGKTDLDPFTLEIKKLAEQRKKDIVFTGYMDYHKMPLIYNLANLIVIPSVWNDPSPLTVYESLATGIPLIVSDSGGIPEIVKGSKAKIVNRGNNFVSDLNEAIQEMRSHSERIEKKNIECSQMFSIATYCENMHRMLESLK